MKAKIINGKVNKKFNPICIKITIEDLDELNELWHRLNKCTVDLKSICSERDLRNLPFTTNSFVELWQIIDKYAMERNKI